MRHLVGALNGRRGPGATLLALVAVGAGLVLIVVGIRAQHSAPEPKGAGSLRASGATRAPAASTSPSNSPGSSPSATPGRESTPLAASPPKSLSIPSIDVHTPVFAIGKNPDGTLAVPQPGPRLNQAAWFKNSPTPGQIGSSVIEGHVDSTQGPSVFFKLGNLKPKDTIRVVRKDGVRLVFTVYAVRDFAKKSFPTKLVYGSDISRPTLRLITCSDFDPSIRHHTGNEVVFAHLTTVHRPD